MQQSDRARLAKLLGMLGSNFDGEVLNAARAANNLVRNSGATWESVIAPPTTPPVAHRPTWTPPPPPPPTWRESVQFCQQYAYMLTEWEVEFLGSIAYRHALSEKQRTVLNRIMAKVVHGA